MVGLAGLRNRVAVACWLAGLASLPASAQLVLTDPSTGAYYQSVISAGGGVIVHKDALVVGDVHSHQRVSVHHGAVVEGDVSSVGDVQLQGTVTGSVGESAPLRPLPALFGEGEARALADRAFEHDLELIDETIDDVIFVAGDVRLAGTLRGMGTIIASGEIEVAEVSSGDGPGLLEAGSRISLISFKHVKVGENRALRGALFAAFNVSVEQGASFEGTAVALRRVDVKKGARVEFLKLDEAPPTVTTRSPASGAYVGSSTPVIAATFDDDLSGLDPASLQVALDGQTVSVSPTASGFTLTPSVPLAEVFHEVVASFRDHAGNEGEARWFFGVDLTAPLLSFSTPAESLVSDQSAVEVRVNHLDPGSGIEPASLAIELEGSPLSCTTDSFTSACPVSLPGSGEYSLLVRAADRVGNIGEQVHHFRFSLDLQPPAVVFTAPANGALLANPLVTVAGTVSDDVAVRSVTVGGDSVPLPGGAFTADFVLEDGAHLVQVVAEDVVGRSTAATLEFTVDTLPPGLIVDQPADRTVVNDSSLQVVGRISERFGIDRVEVDGSPAVLDADRFTADVELTEGQNTIDVAAFDRAGNVSRASVTVELFSIPFARISHPPDLAYVGSTTVDVSGEIGPSVVAAGVNGIVAEISGTGFVARGVPLNEGGNVLTVTAEDANGHLSTASVNVVRDLTAPRLAITTPRAGALTTASTVRVSGLVNDIVAGTVNSSEATVTVNGVAASVANRSFVAEGVALVEGENVLRVVAEDSSGNRSEELQTVRRVTPDRARLEIISGDRQIGRAGERLASPLVVAAFDAVGQPIAGAAVVFKVHGDGRFADASRLTAVETDSAGHASVLLDLGSRAGIGAQAVEALASGLLGPVIFSFDVLPGDPVSVVVDAGDQQVGIRGRALPRPVVGVVVDAAANRLSGVPVVFQVVRGSGSLGDGLRERVIESDSDGRVIVPFVLGLEQGVASHVVEASVVGAPGIGIASFTASAVAAGEASDTAIRGVVLDNTNLPVPGVTLRVLGSAVTTTTDEQGSFRLHPAPVGTVKLIVDGSTAQRPGAWPDLEFTMTTISGHENDLGMPIFLLPLDLENGVYVDEARGGSVTLPEIPGFELQIAPGSVTFPGGSKSGLVSVTAVHSDRVPMVPNFGQQPRLIVTIQPAGARFDPPARLTLPNVEALSPGQVTEFYSFDHDLGHFVSIGPGTVSDDGTVITSNRGVGILKAGWHCGGSPSTSGTTHDCPECQKCVGSQCVNDDGKSCDDGDECTVQDRCSGGSCTGDPVRILSVVASLDEEVEDRACVDQEVQFRVEVEQENCTGIEYLWDFGDGTTSTEQNPSHAFEEPGTYVVTVLVKCGNCPKETDGDSLVVEAAEAEEYELEYMNFIPVPYVLGPPVLYSPFAGCDDGPAMVYGGDNRGPDPDAITYRTKSAVTVVPEEACSSSGVKDGSLFKDVKPTKVYAHNALDDGVLDAADEDATGDCDRLHLVETGSTGDFQVTPERISPTAMKVRFAGNAKNPLAPISFGISWEFDVIVDSEAGSWTLAGAHDCYPGHELYVDNGGIHVRLPDSNGFFEISSCLFPPMNIDLDGSGSLP